MGSPAFVHRSDSTAPPKRCCTASSFASPWRTATLMTLARNRTANGTEGFGCVSERPRIREQIATRDGLTRVVVHVVCRFCRILILRKPGTPVNTLRFSSLHNS